jgi:TolB-like protein/Tfp pilus assembly protein PilF
MPSEQSSDSKFEIGHVLFIDIVGYSKLLIEEQKERLGQLTKIVLGTAQVRDSTDEQLIRLPTGDGMALVFHHSAEEPARCALEIAEALRKHPEIPVRMGIHSGPVSEVTDVSGRTNLAGAGINMAQRVMDCGDAGHILLSQHVADDLMQYRQWAPRLRDLGECEVKHGVRLHLVNLYAEPLGNPEVPQKFKPVAAAVSAAHPKSVIPKWALIGAAILIIAAIATFLFWQRGKPRTSVIASVIPEKSIAVLPFANQSRDPDNAYFADGIQDEILTRLSKIADLKVISRTSTQHYKSAPENLPEIGRQLGVAHVLEGSVQKSGDAVRVNVQLIKAANDSHLWADTYDRKLTDIFSVESEVAKAIADQLRAKLTGQEEQVIAAKPTDNPEAYDAYLRGLAYNLKFLNAANSLAAQKYFRDAVRLDPKFALAWALLSFVNARGYLTASLQPTDALREEAREAAETALNLQPNLGEAVLAKGNYHYSCLKDYDTAVRYFEEARQLLPNNSQIPSLLGYVARRRGQWDHSESFLNEAERLDPRNASLLGQHALSYLCLRRFPEALRKFDQVLNITPDDVDLIASKAAIAQAEGDLPRAAALLASLQPGADLNQALETQVYQAILERRPAPVIPRLKEILAKPDPTLGYFNGELRFYLGWAQEVAGEHDAAQESWRQARSELQGLLTEQPENHNLIADLALTNMGLGDKAAAFAFVDKGIAVIPIGKDAVSGSQPLEILARVAAGTGETDRAIAALQKILSIPCYGAMAENVPLTPALLRLDPMFDPLRNDPRFQKLAQSEAPKQ